MQSQIATDDQDLINIFEVDSKYFVFDADHVLLLRSQYRIPGTLVGTLPQSPQQNVLSSLPIQLMPEETALLVEVGVARVVHDLKRHQDGYYEVGKYGRKEWKHALHQEGIKIAKIVGNEKEEHRLRVLQGLSAESKRKPKESTEMPKPVASETREDDFSISNDSTATDATLPSNEQPVQLTSNERSNDTEFDPFGITPTTSSLPLCTGATPTRSLAARQEMPQTPFSYPLFRYLHNLSSQTYYLTPGLRFGCHYLVYPGDPLRFHSHFLSCYFSWNEPLDLMTIVGGGRLGTGVKKGFLMGGSVPCNDNEPKEEADKHNEKAGNGTVRCFCVEWSGM